MAPPVVFVAILSRWDRSFGWKLMSKLASWCGIRKVISTLVASLVFTLRNIFNLHLADPKVDDFPISIQSAILYALLKLICYAFVQPCHRNFSDVRFDFTSSFHTMAECYISIWWKMMQCLVWNQLAQGNVIPWDHIDELHNKVIVIIHQLGNADLQSSTDVIYYTYYTYYASPYVNVQ